MFAELTPKIAQLGERCIPLHIGDTYRQPPAGVKEALARAAQDLSTRYFHYSHPFGRPDLLQAIASRVNREQGVEVGPENIQISCGATGALAVVAQSMLNPGDEVIVLGPFWPIIRGIVQVVGGVTVEVDYKVAVQDPKGVLTPLISERTKAIYFANPNNPDGYMLSEPEARALYAFAEANGLFLWCDEAYEHIVFDGRRHFPMLSLDNGRDKPCVVSVFTFSKSFAMAGLRIGYILAKSPLIEVMRRVCNHQVYSISALIQEAAWAALSSPEYQDYLLQQRLAYQEARDELLLAFPKVAPPLGGAYLWIDCGSAQSARNTVLAWLDQGVSSAPGEAFGSSYARYIRLCYTSVSIERLRQARDILLNLEIRD